MAGFRPGQYFRSDEREPLWLECSRLLALLDPGGQGLILHTVQGGESRPAEAAGLVGLEQGEPLFRGKAQPPAAVGLQYCVVRSSHRWLRYDRYATPARKFVRCLGLRLHCLDGCAFRLAGKNRIMHHSKGQFFGSGFRIPELLMILPNELKTTQRYMLPMSHKVVAGVV